jgi:hypothetical protein
MTKLIELECYAIIIPMSDRIIKSKHNGKNKYYAVRCPLKFESMSDCGGYVAEHRLIMALYLGRALCKNELVFHIDGNTLNNEVDNLRIIRKKCKKK